MAAIALEVQVEMTTNSLQTKKNKHSRESSLEILKMATILQEKDAAFLAKGSSLKHLKQNHLKQKKRNAAEHAVQKNTENAAKGKKEEKLNEVKTTHLKVLKQKKKQAAAEEEVQEVFNSSMNPMNGVESTGSGNNVVIREDAELGTVNGYPIHRDVTSGKLYYFNSETGVSKWVEE